MLPGGEGGIVLAKSCSFQEWWFRALPKKKHHRCRSTRNERPHHWPRKKGLGQNRQRASQSTMRSLLHHEPVILPDLDYDSMLERSNLTSASVAPTGSP